VVAHERAEVVLYARGVEDELVDPTLALVHELTVHARWFTGAGEMVNLMLRRTDGIDG
jgi:hypothetical protein